MTMIQQEFRADGLPSLRPYLKYLLDNGLAEHVQVKWGKSYRWVMKIGGKTYAYKGGHEINNYLRKKIVSIFLEMENKSLNNKSKSEEKTLKNEAANKIIGAFNKRIKLKVDKIDNSMKGKVKAVRVVPTAIGKHQYGNIEALVDNSCKVARRELATGVKSKCALT